MYDVDITEYSMTPLPEDPAWAPDLRHYRVLDRVLDQVPEPFVAGHVLGSVRVEPPIYLPYLEQRLETLGVSIAQDSVDDLDQLAAPGRVVVNCSGLGARELVGDDTMYPVRGQVVHVRNPGITDGFHIETEGQPLTYSLPRNDVVVLGGTRLIGDESVDPDDGTTTQIVDRTKVLDERLAGLEIVDVKVGLRPGRPTLRLERR